MQLSGWNILATPTSIGATTPEWKPLSYFNYYRLLLSGLFVTLFLLGPTPSLLGSHNPSLFLGSAAFYLGFSIYSVFYYLSQTRALFTPDQTTNSGGYYGTDLADAQQRRPDHGPWYSDGHCHCRQQHHHGRTHGDTVRRGRLHRYTD